MFGNHRAKMKNRQGTEGAPCYFSTLYTMVTPIDEVILRLLAPDPSCGSEGSFGPELKGHPHCLTHPSTLGPLLTLRVHIEHQNPCQGTPSNAPRIHRFKVRDMMLEYNILRNLFEVMVDL